MRTRSLDRLQWWLVATLCLYPVVAGAEAIAVLLFGSIVSPNDSALLLGSFTAAGVGVFAYLYLLIRQSVSAAILACSLCVAAFLVVATHLRPISVLNVGMLGLTAAGAAASLIPAHNARRRA